MVVDYELDYLNELYDEKEINEHLDYVPKKLGITRKEFEEIMNTPPRKYEEFSLNWPKKVWLIELKFFAFLFRVL